MKHLNWALAAICLSISSLAIAGSDNDTVVHEERTMVVALHTDDFELAETDISHLEPGDSETIVTESGRVVDLLRTMDGLEIYVDGELIDLGAHTDHHAIVHEDIEIVCESEDDCEKYVWVSSDEDHDYEHDLHALGEGAHGAIVIDGDLESLHEEHGEKVIVIQKKRSED